MQSSLTLEQTKFDEIQPGMKVPFPIDCANYHILEGRVSQKFKSEGRHYASVVGFEVNPGRMEVYEMFMCDVLNLFGRSNPIKYWERPMLNFSLLLDVKDGLVRNYNVTGVGGAPDNVREEFLKQESEQIITV